MSSHGSGSEEGANGKEEEKGYPLNPSPFLKQMFGKKISVKLKWGMIYEGTLACADIYMNLQLINVDEYVDGIYKGHLEELLIRCNNILYIGDTLTQKKPDVEEED